MKTALDKMTPDWSGLFDELKRMESLSSDAKLAVALGVSSGYICSVRKGRKGVSLGMARTIFSRLGRTFDIESFERLFVPVKVRVHTKKLAAVRYYVISRANARCQLCGTQAPFHSPDGLPYLELHHIIPVREGGKDTPSNLVALCPNCYKMMEVSPTPAGERKLQNIVKKYKEKHKT